MTMSVRDEFEILIERSSAIMGGSTVLIVFYFLWKVLLVIEKNKKNYTYFRSNRLLIFTRVSLLKDVILVIGKIVLGCVTQSIFMVVNALYSAGMGFARYNALTSQEKSKEEQIGSYYKTGVIILVASICYIIYSLRMFAGGKTAIYHLVSALIIATYTFTELVFIIKDYLKARKSNNLVSEQIKLIGLSSILICIVLTQVAIMSFTHEGDISLYNGLSGITIGGLSALVGIYMMIRSKRIKEKLT